MGDPFERVLRFKPHLRVEPVAPDRVLLIGERENHLLSGRLQFLVAQLLDGHRPVARVIEALALQASPAEVCFVLESLEVKGYLVELEPEVPPEVAAFWHSLGVRPREAVQRLASSSVRLLALGVDPTPMDQALRAAGIQVRETEPVVEVVLVRDYLDARLEELDHAALERGTPWMLVKPTGASPWIGPVFRPRAGPCWTCLAYRLRTNRPVERYLLERTGAPGPLSPPLAATPMSLRVVQELATTALVQWIARGQRGAIDEHLLTFDPCRLRMEEHAVVRRPQCPACGQPELLRTRTQRPVVLESRLKRFTDDGGHRCVTPEETFTRHEKQISPITGVLSGVDPIPERGHPLRPVYMATGSTQPAREDSLSSGDFHWVSAGKGRTPAQARVSALCEGIERYSATFQGDELRIRARMDAMGPDAIHPHALHDFSERQYRTREGSSRALRGPRAVPAPFDERFEIDWTPVWSLTHGRHRYLPTTYCYTGLPPARETSFCVPNSNGHAAGHCLEEAILQGFLELVERDAVAVWWYNRLSRPSVELSGSGEPYFEALVEHYRALGWRLWALDLTHDLRIPTFAALATAGGGRYCVGFGAHLEARLALQRALTELNQLFDPERRLAPPWEPGAVQDEAYLHPDDGVPARTLADHPSYQSEDLSDDVRVCVERAARVGLETLVLDQTRPDVGLCVAKVVVPGLRHFWPRFGPGRLYDVPVTLGWRAAPLEETMLNPVHLFV